LKEQLKLQNQSGVRISYVYPDSTAAQAGLKVNDIITKIDAQPIDASEHQDSEVFETMIRAYRIGSKVALTVIRDGKEMEIPAELAQQPKLERELKSNDDVELGFKAREISYLDRMKYLQPEGTTGVIVTDVERGGWADVGGLEIEDIIQGINQTPIKDVPGLESILKKEKEKRAKFIAFFIKRGIRTLFLELQPVWE
jgi:S1-C subfamily serine protease